MVSTEDWNGSLEAWTLLGWGSWLLFGPRSAHPSPNGSHLQDDKRAREEEEVKMAAKRKADAPALSWALEMEVSIVMGGVPNIIYIYIIIYGF